MKLAQITFTLLAAIMALQVQAADAPKRKSGLWEIRMQMEGMPEGMPGRGPMQMCVDQASDNVMRERSKEKMDCPVMDINRSAGKVTIHSVCKVDATTTATTDAVLTGDFESNYRNDMTVKYNPPRNGMSTMKMSHEARWLGPCKAGQKPGDVMIGGMPPINAGNAQEMMKDPKFREMMRRQQQAHQ